MIILLRQPRHLMVCVLFFVVGFIVLVFVCFFLKTMTEDSKITNLFPWLLCYFIIIKILNISYERCTSCSMPSVIRFHLIRFGYGIKQSCICSQRGYSSKTCHLSWQFWLTSIVLKSILLKTTVLAVALLLVVVSFLVHYIALQEWIC